MVSKGCTVTAGVRWPGAWHQVMSDWGANWGRAGQRPHRSRGKEVLERCARFGTYIYIKGRCKSPSKKSFSHWMPTKPRCRQPQLNKPNGQCDHLHFDTPARDIRAQQTCAKMQLRYIKSVKEAEEKMAKVAAVCWYVHVHTIKLALRASTAASNGRWPGADVRSCTRRPTPRARLAACCGRRAPYAPRVPCGIPPRCSTRARHTHTGGRPPPALPLIHRR